MLKLQKLVSKLIVTNDYQQYLVHFDWFLSLFQISDVKPEIVTGRAKCMQKWHFLGKNPISKNAFLGYFCLLIKVM